MLVYPILRAVLDLNKTPSKAFARSANSHKGMETTTDQWISDGEQPPVAEVVLEMESDGRVTRLASACTDAEAMAVFSIVRSVLIETAVLTDRYGSAQQDEHPPNKSHLDAEPIAGSAKSDLGECADLAKCTAEAIRHAEHGGSFGGTFTGNDAGGLFARFFQNDPEKLREMQAIGEAVMNKAGFKTCDKCEGTGVEEGVVSCTVCAGLGFVQPVGNPQPQATGPAWDTFTDRARRVITLAQKESEQAKHGHIGTEHLLLGLITESNGVAKAALTNLTTEDEIRAEFKKLGNVQDARGTLYGMLSGLTPQAIRACEQAGKEALALGHPYTGTEHLLLGLIADKDAIAVAILLNLGVDLAELRKEVMTLLGLAEAPASASDSAPIPPTHTDGATPAP